MNEVVVKVTHINFPSTPSKPSVEHVQQYQRLAAIVDSLSCSLPSSSEDDFENDVAAEKQQQQQQIFQPELMTTLRTELFALNSKGILSEMPSELLSSLLELLSRCISVVLKSTNCTAKKFKKSTPQRGEGKKGNVGDDDEEQLSDGSTIDDPPNKRQRKYYSKENLKAEMQYLLWSLDASIASLILMNLPSTTNVFVEDLLDNLLALLKYIVTTKLFPSNPTQETDENDENMENVGGQLNGVPKRGRPPSKKAQMQQVFMVNAPLVVKVCETLDTFNTLAQRKSLQDKFILSICSTCFPCFFIGNSNLTSANSKVSKKIASTTNQQQQSTCFVNNNGTISLQMSSLNVLRTVFSKFPSHRRSLLEEILTSLPKLLSQQTTSQQQQQQRAGYQLLQQEQTHNQNQATSIHVVTALLLQLLQSCCCENENNNNFIAFSSARNSFDSAVSCAKSFISSLMQLSIKGTFGNCANYFIEVLIQDLIILLHLPEWPSAEIVLHVLTSSLISLNSQQQRPFAIELLGSIGSKLKSEEKLISLTSSSIFYLKPTLSSSSLNNSNNNFDDSKKIFCCGCGKEIEKNGQGLILVCSDCNRSCHGVCGNLQDINCPPIDNQWKCTECSIVSSVLDQINMIESSLEIKKEDTAIKEEPTTKKKKGKRSKSKQEQEKQEQEENRRRKRRLSESNQQRESNAVLRQLVINYLTQESKTDISCNFARKFLLSQFCAEESSLLNSSSSSLSSLSFGDSSSSNNNSIDEDNVSNEYRIFATQLNFNQNQNNHKSNAIISLPREMIIRISRRLAAKRTLAHSFDAILQSILKALSEPQTVLRGRAVKALAELVNSNPELLCDERLRNVVRNSLMDTSISVRQHAVELTGKYVLHYCCNNNEQTDVIALRKYYNLVADRVIDSGISVRKQVVKILRDVCLSPFAGSLLITDACRRLVGRVNDDESVHDLVLQTFKQLWFNNSSGNSSNSSSSSEKTSASQIVDVISAHLQLQQTQSQQPQPQQQQRSDIGIEWFSGILSNVVTTDSGLLICSKICQTILEMILSDDEKIGFIPISNQPQTQQSQQEQQQKVIKQHTIGCLCALHHFCIASPKLLCPIFPTLLPYLHSSTNSDDKEIVQHVVAIVEMALPLVQNPSAIMVSEIETDLMGLISRSGMQVVQTCVRCLCTIVSSVSHNTQLLETTFSKLKTYLLCFVPRLEVNSNVIPSVDKGGVMRSLFILGTLCKYFDFGDAQNDVKDLFKRFLSQKPERDADIWTKALQGLGGILVRWPNLSLKSDSSKEEIISNSFSIAFQKTSPILVKEAALAIISDLLSGCDFLADTAIKSNAVIAGSTIAQAQYKKILELLIDDEFRVRLSAVSTVGLIVRHGIVSPMVTVPFLVAVLSDRTSMVIGERSLRILSYIEEKFPGFVSTKAQEGITLAYSSRSHFNWNSTNSSNKKSPAELISRVFLALKQKQEKMAFVRSVLKPFLFLDDGLQQLQQQQQQQQIDFGFLSFSAEIASCLSLLFGAQDEEIKQQIISIIDRISLLVGGDACSNLKKEPQSQKNKLEASAIILLLETKQEILHNNSLPKDQEIENNQQEESNTKGRKKVSEIFLGEEEENGTKIREKLKMLLRDDNADANAVAILSSNSSGRRHQSAKANTTTATTNTKTQQQKKKRKRSNDDNENENNDDDPDYKAMKKK